MQKTTILFFFLIFLSLNLSAQSRNEAGVKTAVENLRKAIINGDKEQLTKLTSAHLSYGHSNGQVEDQKTFIETLTSGKNDFQLLEMEDQNITIVGKTAIVRNKWQATIKDNQSTYDISLGVILVWVQEKGEWKLLARQAFKL